MYAPPIWRSRHTICDDERESLNSHVQRKSPGELWAVYNCQSDTTKNLGGSTSAYTYTQLRRVGDKGSATSSIQKHIQKLA